MQSHHSSTQYYLSVALAAVVGASVAFLVFISGGKGNITSMLSQNSSHPFIDEKRVEEGIENLRDEEAATIAVVREVSPAVVSIGIFKEERAMSQSTGEWPSDDFFFFGVPVPQPNKAKNNDAPQKIQIGGGTGFIVEKDGLIITNRHVVSDETAEYRITLSDDREFVAKVLARDPVNDIALIKIDAKNLPAVQLGDADGITIGQTVIAIGNALSEFDNTVTRGIVSGINRRVVAGDGLGMSEIIEEAIQTDAAINPGNSGGPLINLRGEVIGVNTAVSRQGQSVGFAIPITLAKRAIESVQKHGRIVRPWLGVRYVLVTKQMAERDKLSVPYGALVVRGDTAEDVAVVPGSPAHKAGLVENDIILSVDGTNVTVDTPLARLLAAHAPGETITLKVYRKGKEKDVQVTLEEFK